MYIKSNIQREKRATFPETQPPLPRWKSWLRPCAIYIPGWQTYLVCNLDIDNWQSNTASSAHYCCFVTFKHSFIYRYLSSSPRLQVKLCYITQLKMIIFFKLCNVCNWCHNLTFCALELD